MRPLSWILGLLCVALGCSGSEGGGRASPNPLAAWTSGPTHVDCSELEPGASDQRQAEELARLIQRSQEAEILEYVDAHPELVCARLTLDMLPPSAWRGWNRSRVVEEVGVAGFVAARRNRSQDLLAALFERGAPHGRVLGLAVRTGRDALVTWLLARGVDPASGDALTEAAAAGELRAVETLLAAGVDPDQLPSPGSLFDDGDPTPLFFAIYTRRRDVAETLLDAGADATRVTAWGRPDHPATLLEWAIFMELWPLSARLVEEGADPGELPRGERLKLERAARAFHLKPVLAALGF